MPVDIEKEGGERVNTETKTPTAFGAFLRRYSLDELPQFFNVPKGDFFILMPMIRMEFRKFISKFSRHSWYKISSITQ